MSLNNNMAWTFSSTRRSNTTPSNPHAIVRTQYGWTLEEANRLLAEDSFEKAMRSNPWTSERLKALGTPWERFMRLVDFHGWVPSI